MKSLDVMRSEESDFEFLNRELKSKITINQNLEKLILIGFTNRTNTGALTTAIGHVPGATRHIQPIKAIARGLMEERGQKSSTPLKFLKKTIEIGSGIQIVKETIGPNFTNPAEWLNSLKLLLDRGLDPHKTCLVPTFRNLFDTVASWRRMWKFDLNNFPFDSFNESLVRVDQSISLANSCGIAVVPYVHEFLRDFAPENVLGSMFELMHLEFNPSVLNWENETGDPYFNGKLIKYDIPPNEWVEGALGIAHGGRGGLLWKPVDQQWQLTPEEIELVTPRIQPAIQIHNFYSTMAQQLLKL